MAIESSLAQKSDGREWTPFIAPLYILWRMHFANRMPIMDCDETFNYWEPLHFLLYANGHQTWEYANQYALRTYAYLYPLRALAFIIKPLLPFAHLLCDYVTSESVARNPKLGVFLLLRASLAVSMAIAELIWLSALASKHSRRHAFWTGLVLLTATGMNHAAAAFLPSSSWIFVWLLASACFLWEWHMTFCTIAVSATLAIGWPFGVVLLVPMGARILWRVYSKSMFHLVSTLLWTVLVTLIVQCATMWIDYQEYGRWTSATMNIFQYNAAGGGDELYGVEHPSFYLKNILLNLNLSTIGIFVLPFVRLSSNHDWDLMVLISPLYLWLGITVPRPHKEERFMFSIYPILCLSAVLLVDRVVGIVTRFLRGRPRQNSEAPDTWISVGIHVLFWGASASLSLSRSAALIRYYSAPLQLYAKLGTHERGEHSQFVCTCGEWYRFPGTFFLPAPLELRFLQSSFKGQLPQPFSEFGSGPQSRQALQPFNDQNLEQAERYVDRDVCDWIVDLEFSDCWFDDNNRYQVVERMPFLDGENTSFIHRILYVPFWHERALSSGRVQMHSYVVAKKVDVQE